MNFESPRGMSVKKKGSTLYCTGSKRKAGEYVELVLCQPYQLWNIDILIQCLPFSV